MGKRKHFSRGSSDTDDMRETAGTRGYAEQQEPYSRTGDDATGGVGYSGGSRNVTDRPPTAKFDDAGEQRGKTALAPNERRLSMGCSGVESGSGLEKAMHDHAEKMHPVGRR